MLSPESLPYIRASVPVLREHGLAITRHFYAQMFAAHPELKNLFNMGNQRSGAQQNALAAAVLAYAAHLDEPSALATVIERIAHKHAAVGIEPAQYTIVGRYLLDAIKSVLGSAASIELLSAWDEAYWLLATQLIAAEARLYERAAIRPGELRPLRVARVERETPSVVSFYLQDEAGGCPGAFEPGQYVSVAVDLPELGLRQLRQYSLSDAPHKPYWRISVKAETSPAGMVSTFLHAHVRPGDTLRVSPAFGNYQPLTAADGTRPIALLSAGVGITPHFSVLASLAHAGSERPVLFAHAVREPAQALWEAELEALRARLPGLRRLQFCESGLVAHPVAGRVPGRMRFDRTALGPFVDADFFLCGPLGFMRAQWQALVSLGVAPARIEREVFGPELLDGLT